MQRPRQQRALHAAPRRSPATRRRPEWNGYLTDADRYKLSQQQQLQRQLQQLSTAHFVSRSPRQAASAARRVEQRAALTPRTATPRTPLGRGVSGLGERSSSGRTARRLQFADEALSPESRRSRVDSPASFVSGEPTPRRRMGVEEKASLQNELALLERMLWDLEVETERLGLKQAESDADQDAEDNLRDSEPLSYGEEDDEEDQRSEQGDGDDGGEAGQRDRDSIGDAAGEDRGERARLEEVCHKSLAVSMSLAQKVNQLAKQLEDERRLRHEHEMRVDVLERELRATQAKCGYLEAKCDGMNSQLEEMHEAVMSTDDAIHRMAQAFDRTRFSSARSPAPSTPHRQGYSTPSRKTPAKSALKQTPRPSPSSTPSRNDGREDDEPTQLENLPPNRPH